MMISLLALVVSLYAVVKSKSHVEQPLDRVDPIVGRQVPTGQNVKTIDLPESLYFAGERVPLEDPDVRERLDREIHVNSFFHSSTIFLLKRSNRWLPQIEQIFREAGMPEDLVYLSIIESGLQNVVSPSQAVGFWQILKGTGKELGLEINREVDERYDPIKSTYAAIEYLKEAYEKFGNWTNAAASYNIGKRGLEDELDEQQVDSYYDLDTNQETSRYLFRAMALKMILNDPGRFGFEVKEEHLYRHEPTEEIEVSSTIKDLAIWAKDQGINYKTLVRHNPWLRRNKLTVRSGDSYFIKLPANG